jgi:hypothetical protein
MFHVETFCPIDGREKLALAGVGFIFFGEIFCPVRDEAVRRDQFDSAED